MVFDGGEDVEEFVDDGNPQVLEAVVVVVGVRMVVVGVRMVVMVKMVVVVGVYVVRKVVVVSVMDAPVDGLPDEDEDVGGC